ncbi:hypothetical protein ACTU6U_08435 [Microbacterium sp. A196]|uniref:hypothetical protein n=1 Tax=Microbacterium sp. A196 TaxID=3457320 RepID=UPI003FCFC7F7
MEGPSEWQQPHPAIAAHGDVVYVTDAANSTMVTIGAATGEVLVTGELPHSSPVDHGSISPTPSAGASSRPSRSSRNRNRRQRNAAGLSSRAEARTDHFMPATLLGSQLETLEDLGEDEAGFDVTVDRAPEALVAEIVERLEHS